MPIARLSEGGAKLYSMKALRSSISKSNKKPRCILSSLRSCTSPAMSKAPLWYGIELHICVLNWFSKLGTLYMDFIFSMARILGRSLLSKCTIQGIMVRQQSKMVPKRTNSQSSPSSGWTMWICSLVGSKQTLFLAPHSCALPWAS